MYLGHVSGIVDITSAYEQNTDTCHLLLIFVLLWFHMSAGGGGGVGVGIVMPEYVLCG